MENTAFARCQGFLNFHGSAKWGSILSSIASSFLYLCLVIVLAFFVDLMVDRGALPSFHHLSAAEQDGFIESMRLPDDKDERAETVQRVQAELKAIGLDPDVVQAWAGSKPGTRMTAREAAAVWWVEAPRQIEARVGSDAARRVRDSVRISIGERGTGTAEDLGLLSLVVRSRDSYGGHLLGLFAAWNEWTWFYGNNAYLLGLFTIAVLLALIRLIVLFLSNYLSAVAAIDAVTRLRRAVYHHTNRLGTLAFRASGANEAVNISARHIESVHDGLFQQLTIYWREPLKIGLLIAFTLVVNFKLAVAFMLFALLVWLVGGQVATYYRKQGRKAQQRAGDQLVLIQESLTLMRLVKVYLMETFNTARVEKQLGNYADAQLKRYRGEAIYLPMFFLLGVLAVIALLLVAGYVVLSGGLSVASTLVLATAIISLYWPIIAILEARRVVRASRRSAKVMFDFLDRQGGVGQAIEAEFAPPLSQSLEFENVSFAEAGASRQLLSNINLTIPAGAKISIVGPAEKEKHALVYLLASLVDPTTGEIRLDGKGLPWVTLESLRAQIAMVLQESLIFNDTVANNIGCGDPSYNMQRVIDAAKIAHAHQLILRLPQGYETVIGELGHPLKVGEMYRIALARAILRDPAILIIEETREPLDDDTKGIVDDTFRRILPGRTVIFLPHRLSTIKMCDQIYLLNQGQIEASGDHRDLLNSSDLYRHLQYIEFNEFSGVGSDLPAPQTQD